MKCPKCDARVDVYQEEVMVDVARGTEWVEVGQTITEPMAWSNISSKVTDLYWICDTGHQGKVGFVQ